MAIWARLTQVITLAYHRSLIGCKVEEQQIKVRKAERDEDWREVVIRLIVA
jgi:hypothetical protein